jgi:hypothetical protein
MIALALSVSGNAAAAITISSNSQVAQNTISGHQPPTGKHANLIAGSVTGTDVANGTLTSVDVKDQSLTLSDIAGLAADGTIGLSAIPNGTCHQVNLGFSGAQVGDSPIVTIRAAIQDGVVLYPNRVSSAGVVEINACNFSGSDMTPIGSLPIRLITLR